MVVSLQTKSTALCDQGRLGMGRGRSRLEQGLVEVLFHTNMKQAVMKDWTSAFNMGQGPSPGSGCASWAWLTLASVLMIAGWNNGFLDSGHWTVCPPRKTAGIMCRAWWYRNWVYKWELCSTSLQRVKPFGFSNVCEMFVVTPNHKGLFHCLHQAPALLQCNYNSQELPVANVIILLF